jgi:ATP-binding cassette, subfamily B, vacuolar membrane transporter HMT1/ACLQ
VVASFFAWSVVLISLIDTKPSPTSAHLVTWLVALPLELIIIGASLAIYTVPHHEPQVGDPVGGKRRKDITGWEILEVIVYFCRLALLLGLSVIYLVFKIASRYTNRTAPGTPASDEQAPLLGSADHANDHPNGQAYGSSPGNKSGEAKEQQDAWAKPTETPSVNWYQYLKGYMVLLPYLWPAKSPRLQLLALTCFTIMIAQRAINVFVPMLTAKITDALTGKDGPIKTPWALISVYILCRWLQGGQGLLGAARAILWVPVEQYAYRAISNAAFVHVHNLSAEFHTGKRTGEVISALNKGSSINSFLSYITFSVGPMIFDLVVAVVYLTITFDVYLGLTVAIVTFLYVYVTIRLAQWRVALRRNTVNSERDMEAVKNDSLHSWDTVKYFNAEEYEFERYRASILKLQGYQYWLEITLSIMNTAQGALFMLALLIACFIEAYQVAQGYQSVGQFVLLIVYMTQLQQPLNFFGTFYRAIQQSLINAERLLELFKEQPTVIDRQDVRELTTCTGDIIFDNVTFGYDKRKPALNSLSFRCQPGTTTALVGESGGGKTTVFRMLFRYYNPDTGRLLIDGNDVQEVSIDSLRRHIGVVPQDCNMFNESVMYNLKYANQSATDDEVYAACRAAAIHDRIIAFPDGYETKVGERGVRLSGGERQRVAIARTILKNPRITLLDEATAALDTETEERIKSAFDSLSSGRTTIIIAHRLSTIVDADQILVLSGGTIVESGTHNELLQLGGKYASMWRKQSRAQQAQEEAEELRKQAKKVLESAEADSASVSEDEIDRVKGRRGHRRGPSERKVNFEGRTGQAGVFGSNANAGRGAESHGHGHGHPH